MECTIKEYSETLISELALRDELEYEKELKNSFISLLLSIQNKWRMLQMDKKQKNRKNGDNKKDEAGSYLTTVIPYHAGMVPPDIPTLQILIKGTLTFT
ncbi:PREDICTED: fasciculation and elongation protein zeta-2-like [Priapulus caudatus]|uniref:Fasciculation and elongation protein zeta-2-like n=1 Tax=Priapulus caudatus TaxID=37621 RepID=A0ABM1EJL3_PRICU|nr:PREDICTED: fasciculation and elongation protein zeta-2-like [Priapulus caudatus]